ncbi:MAG TPA: NF038122 family metalloprotease [Caulobacteraceae bacterium]|nr:NF038122 family metalloprotease [Caulobacteraceae bacterium]
MQITLTWDSSVNAINLPGAQLAQFEAAVTDAAAFFDRLIASPVSVTLAVGYGEITMGGVASPLSPGGSEGGYDSGPGFGYASVKSAMLAHETSLVQSAAYSHLPASDPTSGGNIFIPVVEANALGLSLAGFTGLTDTGEVGFGGPIPGASYGYDPLNRAVSGQVDFIGIAEHELAHALGRVSYVGAGISTLSPFDLFRFSSAGQLSDGVFTSAYLSLDGGATAIQQFDTTGSDPSDWLNHTKVPGGQEDAFAALVDAGSEAFLSTADLEAMNLLGYQIGDQAPRAMLTGDGVSDPLIQNSAGAVVVGELIDNSLTYHTAGALGPEWKFVGTGDFTGDFRSRYLIENSSGAIVLADSVTGSYTVVGGLGPEWAFHGVGDLLGDGRDQFLIENTGGALVVGEVNGASTTYASIGAIGPEWSFGGTGDFLGDGKDQFLIENSSGGVVVGEVVSGTAQYTLVSGLGGEWRFRETGDFLGDGKDQFLIENTAGAVVVGEVVSGQVHYTQVSALGPEWKFVGAGDYAGSGQDSFMIENSTGAIVTGTVVSGQAVYALVGGLGGEWAFKG